MVKRGVVVGVGAILLGSVVGCGGLEGGTAGTQPPAPRQAEETLREFVLCGPTVGGPYWLEEGESLALKVSCSNGRKFPPQVFRFESLPPGARYDSKTGTLHWTPGLDQAAVYELTVRGPANEPGWVKVGVADNWKHPQNVPVVDPARYTEEYGLPVFHLQGAANMNPDAHVPITLVYRGHSYAAEGKIRGVSSLAFPKNSYTLKFPKEDPFSEPTFGNGFTGRRGVVLINTFNDNSYLRARMGFELWNRLSPNSLQVKTFSAVVFRDGVYHGLYTASDHINDHLMVAHGLNKDGNLYQGETGAANFRLVDQFGRPKRHLAVGYEKKEGKPKHGEPGAYADLEDFVRFVATASDEAFRAEAPQRMELRDYENWWALVTLLVAQDSDVKNVHHYHDPLGGPWRAIPWDLDGSFGQSWKTQRLRHTAPMDQGTFNELFRRILAEPTFSAPLKARLRAALSHELAPALLQARLDEIAQEIGPSARRDEARWGEQYRTFPLWSFRPGDYTTFEQEVAYIRQWIPQRWAFLDAKLAPAP